MYSLDPRQKELILDYCLGRCSPSQRPEAKDLIDHNEEASQWRARMEPPLRPLSCPPVELCPDRLAEITVQRLCQQARLEGRWRPAEPKVIQIGLLRRRIPPAVAIAAVAACVVFAVGIFFSPLPSGPYQRPVQVSQENAGDTLNRAALDGPDRARFYAVDGNQNPALSPGIPWPGELNPYPPYPFLQQGPPMLPASLGDGLGFRSPDRFPSLAPVATPDHQR
jgi:hypothetical protein